KEAIYLFPSKVGWQLFRHSGFLMRKGFVKYIGSMFQQLNDLYNRTKIHSFLHCFSSHPISGLEELRCVIRLTRYLIELHFSFHKYAGWFLVRLVSLAFFHV